MSAHDNDEEIKRDAFTWLLGAGAFALALSVFLAMTDYGLSHSKGQQVLGDTLREMRTAQASMRSRVLDERQLLEPNRTSDTKQ